MAYASFDYSSSSDDEDDFSTEMGWSPAEASLLTLTENCSATFSSSGDACVDFFFQIVPDTPSSRVVSLLELAWKQDALAALKLVFHLRGIRGTGKSNKLAFYTCTSWLHQHHPKTLHGNLDLVPKFGYYKDLLEIVLRELEGPEETEKKLKEKESRDAKVLAAKAKHKSKETHGIFSHVRKYARTGERGYHARKGEAARKAMAEGVLQDREVRIAAALKQDKEKAQMASQLRKQKREDMASRLHTSLKDNSDFATLHDVVAAIFAKQLLADKSALDASKFFEISFAAKWCPSLNKSYDLRTGLYHAIAEHLLVKEFLDLDAEKRALALVSKMRKEFLVPIRKALEMPEIYMSANRWSELPYERVPSVAMTNYVGHFVKHDSERYVKFLENVASGKKKVAAGALLPHKVAKEAVQGRGKPQGILAEAQWKRMVSDLKESGSKLNSSMAVCDVSGSMSGTPMEVCIALGLLVAELSEEPFKNHLCTFSAMPEIHLVQGETLADRYKFTERMNWDMNTDFQKVFRRLLDLAQASDLPKDKMVKRLFVFSDMEFDQASANPWETDYKMIAKMYEEAGYGEPPEIVFWNLRDSISTPALSNQKGVALVSGFSKNLLKIFLDENTEPEDEEEEGEESKEGKKEKPKIDPKEVMAKALAADFLPEENLLVRVSLLSGVS
ncbi:hypothetical protein GOP47_0016770 [Adiantum capillus-veneris]|uniref:DUF2828 domain-containing protein n=1 Tax=Adiantum capillus-veneris TaxID=13818 RepID=A0A9D4ZCE5_ADICA|nr:hypothetical protein GOP47_0016770 [Adiantum capillus-veneris]